MSEKISPVAVDTAHDVAAALQGVASIFAGKAEKNYRGEDVARVLLRVGESLVREAEFEQARKQITGLDETPT